MQRLSDIKEIKLEDLQPYRFIKDQVKAIKSTVKDGTAINALSGGVDSSVVTMLGHRALGDGLRTVFVENGIMREGEPQRIVKMFKGLGVKVELVDARTEFFTALKGLTDPEEKREAITQTFYKTVFGRLVKRSGARFLLQGTNYTDVEETVAGVRDGPATGTPRPRPASRAPPRPVSASPWGSGCCAPPAGRRGRGRRPVSSTCACP